MSDGPTIGDWTQYEWIPDDASSFPARIRLRDAAWMVYYEPDISDIKAENAKLRKENDTLCRRIDELCREVESLRRTARRIVVSNHDTDCATGHTECSECHGTVNPYARYCEHCGARLEDA